MADSPKYGVNASGVHWLTPAYTPAYQEMVRQQTINVTNGLIHWDADMRVAGGAGLNESDRITQLYAYLLNTYTEKMYTQIFVKLGEWEYWGGDDAVFFAAFASSNPGTMAWRLADMICRRDDKNNTPF